jgi:hypothetical protein
MNLLEYEKNYCMKLKKQGLFLEKFLSIANQNLFISLHKSDITQAIAMRMKTYYEVQDQIKCLLNKGYATAGADYFVETVLFYLNVFLSKKNKRFKVNSEKQIISKRGMIRPDISVWKGEEVKAIIECKTNLGWKRNSWEQDFIEREKELKQHFPKAKAFLLVLSSNNWSGFQVGDNRVGKQFFALLSKRLRKINHAEIAEAIENRIEGLFGEILKVCVE